jgi:hypothetical protein
MGVCKRLGRKERELNKFEPNFAERDGIAAPLHQNWILLNPWS